VIIGLIAGADLIRVARLKARQRELELLVDERTEALRTANEGLEIQKTSLQESADALKRSNQELEQFAYVASHDLQEPLRMVLMYCTLLEKRLGEKLEQDAKEFIHFAIDGAQRMQGMIRDLLTFSRISSQRQPFEKVCMKTVMEHVTLSLAAAIEEKKAHVTFGELPDVLADASQIERLMLNLVSNGIKYQSGEAAPNVSVTAVEQNGEWQFSVQDNGIGIAPKYRERVFGVFARLHSREEYEGTGIGLAICKKIVEQHGGRIWIDSAPEHGSIFRFTLPKN
jgi:light-regulated signal transduction histidine kinase (bacteriophytochrome)